MKKIIKLSSVLFLITFISPYAFVSCSNSPQSAITVPGLTMLGVNPYINSRSIGSYNFAMAVYGLIRLFSKKIDRVRQLKEATYIYGIILILFVLAPVYIKINYFYKDMYIELTWGAYLAMFISLLISMLSALDLRRANEKEFTEPKNNIRLSTKIIMVSILLSLLYLAIFSKMFFSNSVMNKIIYLLGVILIPVVLNWYFGYRQSKKANLISGVLAIMLSTILQVTIILNTGIVLNQYYSTYNYQTIFSFGSYTQQEGNLWVIYTALIGKGIYPISRIIEGNDSTDYTDGSYGVDTGRYAKTIYRINDDFYIIYDWSSKKIITHVSEEELIHRYFGNKKEQELINLNLTASRVDVYIKNQVEYYYIVPEDNQIVIKKDSVYIEDN